VGLSHVDPLVQSVHGELRPHLRVRVVFSPGLPIRTPSIRIYGQKPLDFMHVFPKKHKSDRTHARQGIFRGAIKPLYTLSGERLLSERQQEREKMPEALHGCRKSPAPHAGEIPR